MPLDRGLSVLPSREWQDNLSRRLTVQGSYQAEAPSPSSSNAATSSHAGSSLPRRRRLNSSQDTRADPDWNGMYTLDSSGRPHLREIIRHSHHDLDDSLRDPTEGMGELSLDENAEVCLVIPCQTKLLMSLRSAIMAKLADSTCSDERIVQMIACKGVCGTCQWPECGRRPKTTSSLLQSMTKVTFSCLQYTYRTVSSIFISFTSTHPSP